MVTKNEMNNNLFSILFYFKIGKIQTSVYQSISKFILTNH